jgi:GLPGLI family protein
MKSLFLATIGALTFSFCIGQSDTSGTIDYKELVTFEISLDGVDSAQAAMMAQFMPKEQTFYKQLFFDKTQSLFIQNDSITRAENEARMKKMRMDGGPMIRMQTEGDDSQLYIDMNKNTSLQKQTFMDREFLIEEKIDSPKWKITGKQKLILDYMCIEATTTIDSSLVTAWFTPQIINAIGPNGLNGLPGAILEVEMDKGMLHYVATKVSLKPLDKKAIVRPTEGKKVTKEEFEKIVVEKEKEMEEIYGKGDGKNVIIKMK